MTSTSKPQDAFKAPRLGTWTCMVCVPHLNGKGGQQAFNAHYNQEHTTEPPTPPKEPDP